MRNLAVNGLYIPEGMTWQYDPSRQMLLPNVDYQSLVNGTVSETVEVPVSPVEAGINTGFSVPGLQIPPLPILTVPPAFGDIVTTQTIIAFQADYARWTKNPVGGGIIFISRNVTLDSSSLTASLSSVQFTPSKSGVYQMDAFIEQVGTGGTVDGYFIVDFLIDAVTNQLRSEIYAPIASNGVAVATGHVGGVAVLAGGSPVQVVASVFAGIGGAVTAAPSGLSFSIVRISA